MNPIANIFSFKQLMSNFFGFYQQVHRVWLKHHLSNMLSMQRRREQIDDKLKRIDSTSCTNARSSTMLVVSRDQSQKTTMKRRIVPRSNVRTSRISPITPSLSQVNMASSSSMFDQHLVVKPSQICTPNRKELRQQQHQQHQHLRRPTTSPCLVLSNNIQQQRPTTSTQCHHQSSKYNQKNFRRSSAKSV